MKVFLSVLCLMLFAAPVMAADVELNWTAPTTNEDGSPLTDLGGYIVYYGMSSGDYITDIDVGNVTTHEVIGLSDNVTYYFAVKAYDTSYNKSIYSNELEKFLADTMIPIITDIKTNIGMNNATISWNTDEDSDTQIEYGPTLEYGSLTVINANLTTTHSVGINNLDASTLYHYRALSRDAAGNLATSGDYTFTTLADTMAPSAPVFVSMEIN